MPNGAHFEQERGYQRLTWKAGIQIPCLPYGSSRVLRSGPWDSTLSFLCSQHLSRQAEKVMDGLTTLQDSETHMWAQLYYGNGETLNPSRGTSRSIHTGQLSDYRPAQYSMGAGGDSAVSIRLPQALFVLT